MNIKTFAIATAAVALMASPALAGPGGPVDNVIVDFTQMNSDDQTAKNYINSGFHEEIEYTNIDASAVGNSFSADQSTSKGDNTVDDLTQLNFDDQTAINDVDSGKVRDLEINAQAVGNAAFIRQDGDKNEVKDVFQLNTDDQFAMNRLDGLGHCDDLDLYHVDVSAAAFGNSLSVGQVADDSNKVQDVTQKNYGDQTAINTVNAGTIHGGSISASAVGNAASITQSD